MKNSRIVRLAAGLLAGNTIAHASLFTETFDTYPLGALPGSYTTESSWEVYDDPSFGAGSQVARGVGSQNNLMTSFTPKALAVGLTISLQFDYRYTGVPIAIPQGNFIRFGLYDSHGTASYADDTGFHADITHFDNSAPGTGGFYQLRQESNSVDLFAGLLLDNQPGVLTAPPPDSDGSTLFIQPKSVSDGTTVHTARLEIRREVVGMTLALYVDDFTTPKVSGFTGTTLTSFDTLLLEKPAETATLPALHIDNLVVDASPVPEPEAYAGAFAAGALGYALWRRRGSKLAGLS